MQSTKHAIRIVCAATALIGFSEFANAGVIISPGVVLGVAEFSVQQQSAFGPLNPAAPIIDSQIGGAAYNYASGGLVVVATGGADPTLSLTASGITPSCAFSCIERWSATVNYQVEIVPGPGAPVLPLGVPIDVQGQLTTNVGYLPPAVTGGYHPAFAGINLSSLSGGQLSYSLRSTDYFSQFLTGSVPPPTTPFPPSNPVTASASTYTVQPGDVIDVSLVTWVTVFNATDVSSATVDPLVSIDPSFAAIDPNYLNDFQVQTSFSAVPEPATWAMFLVGFGTLGFMMRGSRRKTAAVTA